MDQRTTAANSDKPVGRERRNRPSASDRPSEEAAWLRPRRRRGVVADCDRTRVGGTTSDSGHPKRSTGFSRTSASVVRLGGCIIGLAALAFARGAADDWGVDETGHLRKADSATTQVVGTSQSEGSRHDRTAVEDEGPPLVRARQVVIQPVPNPTSRGVLVLADRLLVRRLKTARDLIAKEQYATAVEYLQHILDRPGDSFYRVEQAGNVAYRSLKAEARTLLSSLPQAGREVYEQQFGPTAEKLLKRALEDGDADQLAAVARRFPTTQAGQSATLHLALYHFDRGRPLAAALCFHRLLFGNGTQPERALSPGARLRAAVCLAQAGLEEESEKLLQSLRSDADAHPLVVAGERLDPTRLDVRSLPWWNRPKNRSAWGDGQVAHGNAARTGMVGYEQTVRVEWKRPVSTLFDPLKDPTDPTRSEWEARLASLLAQWEPQADAVRFPAGQPLLAGDAVVVRTLGNVRSLRPTDGRILWETLPDAVLEAAVLNGGVAAGGAKTSVLGALVGQRAWDDVTFGTLASDGRRVFAVEDLSVRSPVPDPATRRWVAPSATNRLAAYDLKTGKLVWEVGGPAGADFELPLSGSFFLGPGLPLGGSLYVLADAGGETRLLVLDAASGAVDWMQPLVADTRAIAQDPWRRVVGASPAFADGIMVCPTEAGHVVALDLADRSLLWSYEESATAGRPLPPVVGPRPLPKRAGWIESYALIASERVLLPSQGADAVVCLNLLDGRLLWKKPRGDGVTIAGATGETVIVLGAGSVRALKLSNGSPAWPKPLSVDRPSGRCALHAGKLFVPQWNGKVLVVELETGRRLQTLACPAGRPGNLLVSGRMILSQGADAVTAWMLPDGSSEETAVRSGSGRGGGFLAQRPVLGASLR